MIYRSIYGDLDLAICAEVHNAVGLRSYATALLQGNQLVHGTSTRQPSVDLRSYVPELLCTCDPMYLSYMYLSAPTCTRGAQPQLVHYHHERQHFDRMVA